MKKNAKKYSSIQTSRFRTPKSRKVQEAFRPAMLLLSVGLLFIFPASQIRSLSGHPLDAVYSDAIAQVAPPAPGLVLLRRLSFQIRGLPPSLKEIEEFENANPKTRLRSFAIRFLRDPNYAHYWATKFASALRVRDRQRGTKPGSYFAYISRSLHKNKSYKQFVSELLLAKGSPDKNPAVNFYLRDEADPLQIAEYVGRVFYGARLSCARCHDHPFNKNFTRRDYYGFAAFFSQAYIERRLDTEGVPRHRWEDFPKKVQKQYQQKRNEWWRTVWQKMSQKERENYKKKHRLKYFRVGYHPDLSLRFPYSDNAPGGDLVKLRFPDGSRALVDKGEDRRAAFVEWLTDEENDHFRKVLINRIWESLMGWAFFYPFDNWSEQTRLAQPEILDHLDGVFLKKDYKIKDLVLYIVTSDAWARRSPAPKDKQTMARISWEKGRKENTNRIKENPYRFFPPRRLDASQLLNALIIGSRNGPVSHIYERAAKIDPMGKINLVGHGRLLSVKERPRDLKNACEAPRPAASNTFLGIFGEGPRRDVDDNSKAPTIDQALALFNGRVTGQILNQFRKKDNWLVKDYERHKDILRTFDKLYFSLLGRPMHKKERAMLRRIAKHKYSRQNRKLNTKLIQAVAWSIINSHEFLHIY